MGIDLTALREPIVQAPLAGRAAPAAQIVRQLGAEARAAARHVARRLEPPR